MIEWQLFFKINFWPNYISCCTACKDTVIKTNPYGYEIIQVTHLLPGHALANFPCMHRFGGVTIDG